MTGSITVNLPLKPYLIKYLQKKYGAHHIVNRSSLLGSYFIELLDKQYRKRGAIKDGDFYPLIVPREIVKNNGFEMAPIKYTKLEQIIDKLFRSDLYSYIDLVLEHQLAAPANSGFFNNTNKQAYYSQNIMISIKQFFKSYNITEDDIKLESIYRDYSRYKQQNKTVIEKLKQKCS